MYNVRLSGIWGSAFCIQFKRLLQDDKKVNQLEEIQQEREELGQYSTSHLILYKVNVTYWFYFQGEVSSAEFKVVCAFTGEVRIVA